MEKHTRQTIDPKNPHVTVLRGEKSKKQLKSQKTRKKQFPRDVNPGKFTLPREASKYSDFSDLHRLWKSHVKAQISSTKNVLLTDSSAGDFQRILSKLEFQGSKISVLSSKCPTLVNIEGIVLLESRHTFQIISEDNKIRTIPKRDSVFLLKIGSWSMKIFGKHLNIRPAERSIKKIKQFLDVS